MTVRTRSSPVADDERLLELARAQARSGVDALRLLVTCNWDEIEQHPAKRVALERKLEDLS
jgi:hypothetical protein